MPVMIEGTRTTEWRRDAECRGPNGNWFYPPSRPERREERARREAKAKLICSMCAVSRQCLEFAVETREQHGVWGGLTELERRALETA
ncbi:MAG TPA: WhiB family transcriptional regulator [Acidimicrobiia bacterium]|jgi:WhiB family redox-sensing transcriptional regulator